MERLLLTLDEAAALIGLTKQQFYELTRARSRCRQIVPLPYLRIGRRRMFRKEALQNWILELEKRA